jgi:hypothetical protein
MKKEKCDCLKILFWIIFLAMIVNLIFLDFQFVKKLDFGLTRNRFSKENVGMALNVSEISFREICNVELLSNSATFIGNYRVCCTDLGVQSFFVVNFCLLSKIYSGKRSWNVCEWEEVECALNRDVIVLKFQDFQDLVLGDLFGLELLKVSLSNSTFVVNMGEQRGFIKDLELVNSRLQGDLTGIQGLKRVSLRNSTAFTKDLCSNCTHLRSSLDCDCFY